MSNSENRRKEEATLVAYEVLNTKDQKTLESVWQAIIKLDPMLIDARCLLGVKPEEIARIRGAGDRLQVIAERILKSGGDGANLI